MRAQLLRPNAVLILTCLLALVLFLLGIAVPNAHLWGSFLLPVVLVYLWGNHDSWRRDIYIVSALASMLVLAEYWTLGATTFADLLVNHLAPILILWAVALLLAQRRQQQEQLAQRKQELDAHARLLAAIVEASHEAIISAGTDGTILSINHSAEELYGVSAAETVGRSVADVALPQNISAFGELLGRVGAGETVTAGSWSWQLPDGTARFISASVSPIRDGEGRVTAFAALAHDITARRQAEALVYAQRDLARSIGTFETVESGFHAILEIMLHVTGMDSGGIYLFSPDGRSLELVYHQGLGAEFVAAVGSYPLASINAQMILAGTAYYLAYDQPAAQNPVFRAENLRSLAAVPIHYQERVIGCIYLSSHTEDEVRQFARAALEPLAVEVGNFVVHLQSQAALRASEEKFRQLADTINEVFWIFDNRERRLVYLNPAYEKIWGVSTEDTYRESHKYIAAVHLDDRPILLAALERQAQGEQTDMEYRIVRPDGTIRWIFDRSFPILGEDGQVQRTAGVASDVTALKHNQHELQELNRSLEERVAQRTAEVQDLYDNAPTGYHSLDAHGLFLRVNQTHASWLGCRREELIGRSITEFLTEEGQAVFAKAFAGFKQQG